MRSTFFGLNIGYKGLQAQQRALDITSHNVANANTQGYTRQDVIMEATKPIKVAEGFVGTGVDIAEYRRIRDVFIDAQIRNEIKSLGEWEVKSNIFDKLEVIFNEPSESSLRAVMDEYWSAWQDLSKNPESYAVRASVIQSGITLTDTLNHMDRQFKDLQLDINKSIQVKVNEINSSARQIRDLNLQIVKLETDGNKANDLRDKRDLLVEELAKIVNIDVVEDSTGAYNVTIGGKSLVFRGEIAEIRYTDNPVNPLAAKLEWLEPVSGVSQGAFTCKSGELFGYIEMRDNYVNGFREDISLIALRIAEEVNLAHNAGYSLDDNPGLDFFTKIDAAQPFSAGNIQVNQLIIDDVNLLAAAEATPALQGDGGNALNIAQLKSQMLMNGGVATFDDYFRSTVAELGINTLEATRMADNQTLLVNQLINKREGVSGVSLDEEMTNMIRYQHAYTASARVINTMDEMLDLIVNRLGLVGR